MTRRYLCWLGLCVATTTVGLVAGAKAGVPTPTAPNVVVVVTDDQPYGPLTGLPFVAGRNDFTQLTELHTNNPLCCPSRATLLSGEYSHHTGVETNFQGERFDDSSTLATWLDDAGYATGLFGKYLNFYPWDRGSDYVPPGWDEWSAFSGESGYYDYDLTDGNQLEHHGEEPSDYSTDVVAAKTDAFLAGAQEPFFAYFAPSAPHKPYTPAPRDIGEFADAPVEFSPNVNRAADGAPRWWADRRRVRHIQAQTREQWESELAVDDAIEQFFATLADRDVLDHTVVVVLSDNGYSLGSHRWLKKDCPYEECTHVPFLIRWPGESLPAEIDALVSNIDIAPTIAEITGADPSPSVDGTSLVPLLRGEVPDLGRDVLLRHRRGGDPRRPPTFWGLRTEAWKYVEYRSGALELYDLHADPFELENLAGDAGYAHVERKLARELRSLRERP